MSDISENIVGSGPPRRECMNHLDAVSDALYAIGGKWKLRIIVSMTDGSKRFNEMQRIITGISARVLSNELKDMELNGFVKRTVTSEHPAVVVYELTPYSATLTQVIQSLAEWGASHKEKIMRDAAEAATLH